MDRARLRVRRSSIRDAPIYGSGVGIALAVRLWCRSIALGWNRMASSGGASKAAGGFAVSSKTVSWIEPVFEYDVQASGTHRYMGPESVSLSPFACGVAPLLLAGTEWRLAGERPRPRVVSRFPRKPSHGSSPSSSTTFKHPGCTDIWVRSRYRSRRSLVVSLHCSWLEPN